MKFRVIDQHSHDPRNPIHIIEQTTGWEVGWINRYLDREYVRRLADTTLRTYAYNLLHFVRWWESIHHTGDIVEADLTESTLLDYVALPVQPTTSAFGFPHQRPRCRHRSRSAQPVPERSWSDRSRFSSSFPAAGTHGPSTPTAGNQPAASQGTQT